MDFECSVLVLAGQKSVYNMFGEGGKNAVKDPDAGSKVLCCGKLERLQVGLPGMTIESADIMLHMPGL